METEKELPPLTPEQLAIQEAERILAVTDNKTTEQKTPLHRYDLENFDAEDLASWAA